MTREIREELKEPKVREVLERHKVRVTIVIARSPYNCSRTRWKIEFEKPGVYTDHFSINVSQLITCCGVLVLSDPSGPYDIQFQKLRQVFFDVMVRVLERKANEPSGYQSFGSILIASTADYQTEWIGVLKNNRWRVIGERKNPRTSYIVKLWRKYVGPSPEKKNVSRTSNAPSLPVVLE